MLGEHDSYRYFDTPIPTVESGQVLLSNVQSVDLVLFQSQHSIKKVL